jgi:hypothetical protein
MEVQVQLEQPQPNVNVDVGKFQDSLNIAIQEKYSLGAFKTRKGRAANSSSRTQRKRRLV